LASVAFFAGAERAGAFLATAFVVGFFTGALAGAFFGVAFFALGFFGAAFAGFFALAAALAGRFVALGRFAEGAARRGALGARRAVVFLPALPGIGLLRPACERAMVLPRIPDPGRPTTGAGLAAPAG